MTTCLCHALPGTIYSRWRLATQLCISDGNLISYNNRRGFIIRYSHVLTGNGLMSPYQGYRYIYIRPPAQNHFVVSNEIFHWEHHERVVKF